MTPQEWVTFGRYVTPGQTQCRCVYDDGEFSQTDIGIVMENAPHTQIDKDNPFWEFYNPPELRVTWFDHIDEGSAQFPLCLLEFLIDDEWWDADDIVLFQESTE